MITTSTWWAGVRQPTLQRRSVAFVLLAFFLIWMVLLAYVYVKNERFWANEQPMRKFTEAVHATVEETPDPGQARAVIRATLNWLNTRRAQGERFLPGIDAELLDASGTRIYGSAQLQALPDSAWTTTGRVHMGGRAYRLHEARGKIWTLRMAEPVRTTERFLSYNAGFLLEYLLLALPFVVIPVWWSVRSGLRPLARFADALRGRAQGDLQPVGHAVRHRELQPLSDALDGLLAQLRQKLQRERGFVQDAAHEIRTPLAVVGTQAHVLAHAASAEEKEHAQALLNQAISRASHLAQQLLMLATLDGEQEAAARRIDVAQAVRVLLAQLAQPAMQRAMELSLDAPDELWMAVDEAALDSIVCNLVDNAIRYGRDGGSIAASLRCDDERLLLHVRDDGPGIPPAEHTRVFERFYRVPGNESTGSGLGLAIVQQAAARMGGSVTLTEGLAGRGVGFLVSLPVPGFRAD
jgi:two-component system sensor histidine kinase QseC